MFGISGFILASQSLIVIGQAILMRIKRSQVIVVEDDQETTYGIFKKLKVLRI